MPMPVPKSMGVVEAYATMTYISFVEAQVLTFIGEHQPFPTVAILRTVAATRRSNSIRILVLEGLRIHRLHALPS